MFIFIIRSIIIYFILFSILRIMGKRQIGELQPFELVITLMLAELAILPMQETGLSLLNGIVPLLTLVCLHFFLSFFARKSLIARRIVSGQPVIVINPDGIQYEKLKQLNMNINDLQEGLRSAGYFRFDAVAYAIVETNGKLSVLPKSKFRPLQPNDISKKVDKESLDVTLVIDGKLIKHNLILCNISQKTVAKEIKKAGIKNIKDCLLLTVNQSGDVFIQSKYNNKKISHICYKGGNIK